MNAGTQRSITITVTRPVTRWYHEVCDQGHVGKEDDQMLRPFVHQQSHMLKDFGDLLESSLWKLKNDVALIVKKKRECLLHVE